MCVTSWQTDPTSNVFLYVTAELVEDICMTPSEPLEGYTWLRVSKSLSDQSFAEFMVSFTELMVTTANSTHMYVLAVKYKLHTSVLMGCLSSCVQVASVRMVYVCECECVSVCVSV